jgi:hypothetical protein|nr:MAG TPA: hypothetical protein [Caudoviricetes sp.]
MDSLHGDESQLGLLDILAMVSFCIQLMSMEKNAKQLSNDDIMEELQRQDGQYLETIIGNQNKIMSMLEKLQTN